ncbi:uridine diphosphate glucose pyrophosphatase NUDT22 [Echeneis naucrates]|uniref:Nudix hydrolase domain-containing protein n=1 Tax=Echeneis naucrates TaxID=173247 RepID=A0A665XDX4_ECHNA|nr:uridine diphosphate glucose pyrophosphatase [Echeneis naucrates]
MTDPEVSVLADFKHSKGLLESQVQVELSERFNRQTDSALERHIEDVWTERVSKEPWLFNEAKFRLHSFCLVSSHCSPSSCASEHHPCTHSSKVASSDCVQDQNGSKRLEDLTFDSDPLHDDTQNTEHRTETLRAEPRNASKNHIENASVIQQTESKPAQALSACRAADTHDEHTGPLLTLRLGLTCYKDYLGTNWSCRVAELRQRGEEEFADPLAFLAQPLGVGAILCTDNGQVVLIRRSQSVAEAGGLLDIPGGHPEPKAVCEDISMVMMQQRREAVVSELFKSVCAEIRDEVNVPLSCLGEPVLMGVALNHTSAGRPSAEFYVSCSLTSDEVRKLYWEGGAEAHESTDIVFLSRREVLQLDRSRSLWTELCPSAKGAVMLYQTVKPDAERERSWQPGN